MGLFGSDDDPGRVVTAELHHSPEQDDDERIVNEEVERAKSYTEHAATVTFQDGSTKDVTFDAMNRRGKGGVTLKDYTGYSDNLGQWKSETFLFLAAGDLRSIETTERTDREMEYTATRKVPASEAGDGGSDE